MTLRRMLPPAAAILALTAVSGASTQADRVDDYITSELARQKIPGLSLAVVKNGEAIKAQGYGFSNLELKVPATADTIYQSGSVGKQFTATLVMMLVEEGTMSLADPIAKYIPSAPPIWKDITIRHLLTHTSGISNKLYDQIDMRLDYSEDELVKKIATLPLDFQPGASWNYSNPGYLTLGVIVRKATGRFYGDLLREKIFAPLGMTTARIISEEDIVLNRAAGYRLIEGQWKNQRFVSPALNTTADGSLYLTVRDMAKWDAALYAEKLLKRSSLDLMWTPVKLNDGTTRPYGFGWRFGEVRGHKIIEHGGSWQGFMTAISRYVDDKLTVVVLTNCACAKPEDIGHSVAGLYNPELAPPDRK